MDGLQICKARVDHLEAELKKKDESSYYENWEASFPGKSENDSKK